MKKIFLFLVILSLFVLSRLAVMHKLPIFVDEALDIYLGEQVNQGKLWIPLSTGYLPVFFWSEAIWLRLPISRLLAARTTSLFFGILSFWIFLSILKRLGLKDLKLSALLFVFSPMWLFYQSQAIQESAVLFFSLLGFFLTLIYINKPSLLTGLYLSLTIFLGLMTKTTILLALPGNLVFILTSKLSKNLKFAAGLFNVLPLILFFWLLNKPFFSTVLLHHKILSQANFFTDPVNTIIKIFGNSSILLSWIQTYFGLPLLILVGFFSIKGIVSRNRSEIALTAWFITSLLVLALISNSPYPRYAVTLFIPLYLMLNIHLFKNGNWGFLSKAVLAWSIFSSSLMMINPQIAFLPKLDRWQYFQGWTSGYGLNEIKKFLITLEPARRQILYVEDSTFQSARITMEPNIDVKVFYQMRSATPPQAEDLPLDGYLLFNFWQPPIDDPRIKILQKIKKSQDASFILAKRLI